MDKAGSIKSLQSFSPGWSDPEILEKTLVGRRDLVDQLEELAIDGAGGPNKHQRLIIGFRGSGKTHVLRVIHNRLWSNEELKKRLLIIYLLEDELGVASFLDFVVRLVRAILRWYPDQKEIAQGLEEIYDLPPDRQEARAVQLLLHAAGTRDILIIMENLGITFDNAKGFGLKGQQELRDLVQQHPRFMIFASSQALAESVKDASAPFYGFFKVIHLRRLTLDEAMAFLMAMASAYGNQDVLSFLNTARGRGRMRAIYEFTGGNHRLLVVFYEFLTSDSVAKLSDLFIQALDPLKPFYQEQMRSLSAQQQKIIQFLSLQRRPCTVKEIARACLAAPNTVSSQLKDLLDKNFVSRIGQGRESYYEIAEALFRICHEAELEQEGAPVRLFVDFLGNLYTGEELQLRYRGFSLLANRLGAEGHIPFAEEAELYFQALSRYYPDLAVSSQGQSPGKADIDEELYSLFREMAQSHAYREIIQMAKYLRDEKDAFVLLTEAEAYEELGDLEEAIVHAREALSKDADDVEAHLLLARTLALHPEERDKALEHALRARELAPENPRVLNVIGFVYYTRQDYAEALKQFDSLRMKQPDISEAWFVTGMTLEELDRKEEAETMYRKALELEPKNTDALERLGILVFKDGRYDEALEHFQALNELSPDNADAFFLTGMTLESLDRTEKAEAMYRKRLELEPGNADAWARLSRMLEKLGRADDAAAAFKEAERLGADRWNLLNSRGEARRERGEYMLAISDYEEALQADPQAVLPHFKIVDLLLALGRMEDALARLSSAIEADRESKTPCSNYITRLFFENSVSLFEHAPTASFDRYLTAALDIIGSDDPAYMQRFEESLPLTIFALLKDQENISEVRFSRILKSFENVIGKRMEVSVAVRFLKTGIDHFKNKDKKALLRLTKEERHVFCRELGIV
jgi:tetratricopeptide (TPR) repeat protein